MNDETTLTLMFEDGEQDFRFEGDELGAFADLDENDAFEARLSEEELELL